MKDVLINAPSAVWPELNPVPHFDMPTPEELVALYAAENRRLQQEVEQAKTAASTITNIALCLMWILDKDEVMIPRQVSDANEGGQITIGENADRDVIVHRRTRMPHFLGEEK